MLEFLGFAGVMLAVFVPILIKGEHRLTRLECKVDAILKSNGVDPEDCIKSKSKGRSCKTTEG